METATKLSENMKKKKAQNVKREYNYITQQMQKKARMDKLEED